MAAEPVMEAVFRAAREGDVDIVAGMLDEDPGLLSSVWRGDWRSDTLLTTAALCGHVELVRLLLERGAEVNQANDYGDTALEYAVERGHEEIVPILLTSGADPSRKGYRGQTELISASWDGNVAVVRLLLRSMGCRGLNERDEDGRTAMWYACKYWQPEVLRALLLAGADHTIADNTDTTPLQTAEEFEHHECVAMLQVSTSLVSHANEPHDGNVCAACDAHVVWGRTSQSVPALQWWEGELQRAYVLHKARTLHEDTATRQQATAAPVPPYLSPRGTPGNVMPSVEVVAIGQAGRDQREEEVCAMVGFVVKDLSAELYIELLAGFYK
jgi:hypothetical protein